MSSHVAWNDIRAEHVARARGGSSRGGQAHDACRGPRTPPRRGPPQPRPAPAMRHRPSGCHQRRASQIERGKISGHDVVARYAATLGGRLHQAIYLGDGDIIAIACRGRGHPTGRSTAANS